MAHFSQELEALTLRQNGQGLKTSSIASGKNSLAKSSNTIFPMHNNTETSRSSTRQLTLEELISSPEDSHANRLALQEKEKEQRMNATCGKRCLELSESVNPVGSWARTFGEFVLGRTDWFSKRVTLTWKILGTPSNRLLFQLVPQTLPTDATEFGLLLTPTTSEPVHDLEKFKARMEKYPNGTTMPNLATQVHGMLPTPTTRDYKGARSEEALKVAGRNETNSLPDAFAQSGKTSQLSPLFVEEMMGFPKNWTVSPFQSGEENQSKHTETL
jgi:hypothetical protein